METIGYPYTPLPYILTLGWLLDIKGVGGVAEAMKSANEKGGGGGVTTIIYCVVRTSSMSPTIIPLDYDDQDEDDDDFEMSYSSSTPPSPNP